MTEQTKSAAAPTQRAVWQVVKSQQLEIDRLRAIHISNREEKRVAVLDRNQAIRQKLKIRQECHRLRQENEALKDSPVVRLPPDAYEALRLDAERYRWLSVEGNWVARFHGKWRAHAGEHGESQPTDWYDSRDEAIDAVMAGPGSIDGTQQTRLEHLGAGNASTRYQQA